MRLLFELQYILNLIFLQFKLIFPYWMLGILVGSLLSVFFSKRITDFASRLGRQRLGILNIVFASLLGAASPVCMYGTVPLIASLGRRGMPQSVLAAFTVSSILINPNLFLMSFALGSRLAILRLCVCLGAGVTVGVLVKLFFSKKNLFQFDAFEGKTKCRAENPGMKDYLHDLHRAILITAPYFLLGILLTALMERWIPDTLIIGLFGSQKGLGVVFAASIGVPVYVCGGGTIPLLHYWMDQGMSMGAVLAFMISGPATKLTNLGAVKTILGMKNFLGYLVFHMVYAIVVGLLANLIVGG